MASLRWQRLYYALAFFDVVTVLGGLYLTNQILEVFQGSVSTHLSWVSRMERYSQLGELAGAVNAPGNDVFDDRDVDRHERRLGKALEAFDRAIASVRDDAGKTLSVGAAATLLGDIEAIEIATREMVEEAHRIFAFFRQGDAAAAGRRMATMDRRHGTLNSALARLRADALRLQTDVLARDEERANSLRLFEIPLGAAILAIVGAAMFYGHRVSEQTQQDAVERERYIARLTESDAELRQNQQRLATSEERFQLAGRATSDVLWDYDLATGLIWRSAAFKTLFGYADAAPLQPYSPATIHPDDTERVTTAMVDFLSSSDELWTAEYRFQRKDGSYAWVLDRAYVIRDGSGQALRLIGSMMDISDRKQAERMKSDFVSFVSHQLRTPLSGMNWMLELAADSPGMSHEARGYIADAQASANRLVALINELLDIARLESGRTTPAPAPVALGEVTRSVLHELDGVIVDKRHEVVVTSPSAPPVPPVWADPLLVRQIVTNLLSNAIKYTPAGGRIAVAVEPHGSSVQWSVKDNGIGIPGHAHGRLFEKFYRADNVLTVEAEGTGLGLHLVRLIVHQAGGRIWCESQEGHGSLFAFTLPAAGQEQLV
jgi:PAS domain S-box-containing protein